MDSFLCAYEAFINILVGPFGVGHFRFLSLNILEITVFQNFFKYILFRLSVFPNESILARWFLLAPKREVTYILIATVFCDEEATSEINAGTFSSFGFRYISEKKNVILHVTNFQCDAHHLETNDEKQLVQHWSAIEEVSLKHYGV